jgi:hypothetical protein
MKSTRIASVALLSLLFGTTACKKDFSDINVDPNNPTSADISLVLPSGQAFVSFIVGGQYNVIGEILSQQLGIPAGGNQYRTWDQYNIPSSTFDGRQFQGLYAGSQQDFQYVIDQGTAKQEWRMVGIAKILKAHSFQVLTDLYGDIPFSEALMGAANLTPKYDKQQDVYAGIQALLSDGINDIKKQSGRFPGTADLNYAAANEAGMSKWIRLANTLKLRSYIHISTKDPAAAAAGIRAIYDNGGASQFMAAGDSYQYANITASGSENPFYQTNFRLQNNLAVSSTVGNLMTNLNDPRRSVFFLDADLRVPPGQTTSPIDYLFVTPGQASPYPNNYTFPGTTNAVNRSSYPGTWFIGQSFTNAGAAGSTYSGISATDAAAKSRPTLLLTYEESLFLRAEAAVQGWAPGENAQALYEAAVTASLARYGIGASAATTYLASTGVNFAAAATNTAKLELIATQKYISFFATNGAEAWTEARRTDIPTLQSPLTNTLGAGVFVKRLPYVDSEILRNPKVADTGITPGNLTTPVWWDVK